MEYEIMKFFSADAHTGELRNVALPVAMLANAMAAELPPCEETAAGLRKLLEAQDCFIRATLIKIVNQSPSDE